MIPKKEVVLNSVAEFLGIWALRGEASLSLNTKDGVTTIAFTYSLSGHPEDPLHPPPAPTDSSPQRYHRGRRRRGPARRERDHKQADNDDEDENYNEDVPVDQRECRSLSPWHL